MGILRDILENADDLIVTSLSLRDRAQRSANNLVGTKLLDGFGLRQDSRPGRGQGAAREHRQLDDLQEIGVGRAVIVTERGLPVLHDDRLSTQQESDPLDLRKILLDAVPGDVGGHLAEQRNPALGVGIPGLELIGVVGVRQPLVVAIFVADVEQDQDARRHADGEAGDIDDRIGLALRQSPDRDRPVIPPHACHPFKKLRGVRLPSSGLIIHIVRRRSGWRGRRVRRGRRLSQWRSRGRSLRPPRTASARA